MSEKNTFGSLSDELKAKLKECKTEEELNKVLAEAGLDIDQDVLKAVVGGLADDDTPKEPCQSDQSQYICIKCTRQNKQF